MRLFTILLLFTGPFLYPQKLDAWLTNEIKENPGAYIPKAAKLVPATSIEAAGNFYALGKCYEYLNREEIALKYYLLSKKEFKKLKLEEPYKDLSLEIHHVISSQENYDKYGDTFLNEYFDYAKQNNSKERLALSWNEFGKNALVSHDPEKQNGKALDSAYSIFMKGIEYADQTSNNLIKSKLYTNLGALESTRSNYETARGIMEKARRYILKTGDKYELFINYYNYGNSYLFEGSYTNAIKWYKQAERIKLPKYRDKARRVLFKKMMETYDAINDQHNRRKYQKLYLDLDSSIKDTEQNIAIHDINVKYQVAEKDRQISGLNQFRDKFYKNRLVFAILLTFVFVLAMYSFVRWKKLDYRKKKLEAEKYEIEAMHSKTVEELEKVKSIVTEGYIILKDKTRLYLNDLMYVKSEDHYLHAFTKDGKSHFVRGKLSQIMDELPPNFVKCHRSYIVNTNFIQSVHQGFITLKNKSEIPVSRGFKL